MFHFERERARFRLATTHPGVTADDVRAATGFDYDWGEGTVPGTPMLSEEARGLLCGRVAEEIAEIYPGFARSLSASP